MEPDQWGAWLLFISVVGWMAALNDGCPPGVLDYVGDAIPGSTNG